jgi:hemerythrin
MVDVKQIKKDLRQGNKKDKEIMDQHKQLFNLLNDSTDMMQQNQTKGGSYSYGD